MQATMRVCEDCGKPGYTEVQSGWNPHTNSGSYCVLCEECYATTYEGRWRAKEYGESVQMAHHGEYVWSESRKVWIAPDGRDASEEHYRRLLSDPYHLYSGI